MCSSQTLIPSITFTGPNRLSWQIQKGGANTQWLSSTGPNFTLILQLIQVHVDLLGQAINLQDGHNLQGHHTGLCSTVLRHFPIHMIHDTVCHLVESFNHWKVCPHSQLSHTKILKLPSLSKVHAVPLPRSTSSTSTDPLLTEVFSFSWGFHIHVQQCKVHIPCTSPNSVTCRASICTLADLPQSCS